MKLLLDRKYKKSTYTIGKLYIDGVYFCDTLEDKDRGLKDTDSLDRIKSIKVMGQTAIPRGTYKLRLDRQSPKYLYNKSWQTKYKFCNGFLPLIDGIKGFSGVLVHIGNTKEHTEGCVLVGRNTQVGKVLQSTVTFKALYAKLKAAHDKGESIYIEIK